MKMCSKCKEETMKFIIREKGWPFYKCIECGMIDFIKGYRVCLNTGEMIKT